MNSRVELVAPAGTLEKLRVALHYGADAVYLSGKEFGLRSRAGNFTLDEISTAVEEAHALGKRVYLTLNIFAHNRHIDSLRDYLSELKDIPLDAVIVSDPGVFSVVKSLLPSVGIHISTQANTTNMESVAFWRGLGADRVILSRELSLDEIADISSSAEIGTEVFVHGAMCISYSGRCLLSNYLAERNANLGDCAHPCRWEYTITEKKRPEEPFTVEQDREYTYIMSSRDLCMVRHLPALVRAGVSAFKIEGRMRSAFYVATATRIYSEALDRYYADPDGFNPDPSWEDDLAVTTVRGFTTGFYFGNPMSEGQIYDVKPSQIDQSFAGMVTGVDRPDGLIQVRVKNPISPGMTLRRMARLRARDSAARITRILDEKGTPIGRTHPEQTVLIEFPGNIEQHEILLASKEQT